MPCTLEPKIIFKPRIQHFQCFLIEGKPNPASYASIVRGTNKSDLDFLVFANCVSKFYFSTNFEELSDRFQTAFHMIP